MEKDQNIDNENLGTETNEAINEEHNNEIKPLKKT